jgi:hypothetical protein
MARSSRLYLAGALVAAIMPLAAGGASLHAQGDERPAVQSVTFTRDVAPILQRACQHCHRPGSIAPMSLLTYEEVRPWARAIKLAVTRRDMPPFDIDRRVGVRVFKNDPSLTPEEIATIGRWVDAGAPRGNPTDMPPPRQFHPQDRWMIGTPDVVVAMPAPRRVPARAPDEWLNIEVDAGNSEDRYIQAVEIKPASGFRVIHHSTAASFTDGDPAGQFLVEYAPGKGGDVFPEGTGRLLPAGSKLRINLHLHAIGQEEQALVEVGFKFYPKGERPANILHSVHIGDQENLDIPPGADNVRSDGYSVMTKPVRLTAFQPHLHYRGKAQCMEAILPVSGYGRRDGGNIVPISCASRFRFGWHIAYLYDDDVQPLLPAGTILHVVSWHDNSRAHRGNPDPTNWVGFGQRTTDDMSLAWVSYFELTQEEYDRQVAERQAKIERQSHDGVRTSRTPVLIAGDEISSRPLEGVKYAIGQNVAPVYEGWERLPDGTILMHFGYLNRNYEEELDIPVGTANFFEAGPSDRGQPTHFLTRRQLFTFTVRLPKDWDPKARLIWTVTANGKTERAQGWMQSEWEINDGVQQMNIGPGGAPGRNQRPKVSGPTALTAVAGKPLDITVDVADDGMPPPPKRPRFPGQVLPPAGVGVRWVLYRGPAPVTFAPAERKPTYGDPFSMTTQATFSAPGDYVIRAIAPDGTLVTHHDVSVKVSSGESATLRQ